LSPARKKIVENELRDFKLGGADLPENQKPRFMAIQEELSKLSAKFEENLLDATKAWSKFIEDENDLRGLPDDAKAMFKEMAEADESLARQAGLEAQPAGAIVHAVMQYCENRALREEMYRAYTTRASEFGPAELDNTPLIAASWNCAEAAQMLGFDAYAQVSLAAKMADSPAEVLDFLHELAQSRQALC
jgi:oligopeptidase A